MPKLDALVVGVRKDDKVFYPIVRRIAIDVMHMLPRLQCSAQVLLHQIAVLSNLSAIHCNLLVLVRWSPARLKTTEGVKIIEACQTMTTPRTIHRGLGAIGRNVV